MHGCAEDPRKTHQGNMIVISDGLNPIGRAHKELINSRHIFKHRQQFPTGFKDHFPAPRLDQRQIADHLKRITKPLFIAQGLNDPRVPASEAEQILAAIRSNGGTAWYMLARDEGHGFSKKSNRDHFYHTVALFLEEFLLE